MLNVMAPGDLAYFVKTDSWRPEGQAADERLSRGLRSSPALEQNQRPIRLVSLRILEP